MDSRIRVLHVDDDPEFGELVQTFLERADDTLDVTTVTSASDGLHRMASNSYDCVVSDYDMPNVNGLEFLDAVREQHPELPFILYTGKGSEEVAGRAMSKGATDYLQKSGGTEQYELLANRVRNAVERHRSRREARATGRRLQNLSASLSDCIWMFNRDWDELLFISGYEAVWGRPVEDIKANPQDFLQGVVPDYREFVEDAMDRLSAGQSIDIEYPILRGNDGDTGWVWVKGEPVVDDDGTVTSVVGFTRDITDRKRREERLERYERIVENVPVGIFRTNADGDIVSMNEEFVNLFDGRSPADFADLKAADLYVDIADRQQLLETVESEGLVEDYRFEMETLDGEVKLVETTLRMVEEDGDKYLDGIVQDVTDRQQRRSRLEQAETMFENAQDAMFLVDVGSEFTVERVNPAYERATGLSEADLVGRTPRDILGEDAGADIEARYQECVEQRAAIDYEEELHIDGEPTRWETRIAPVVVDGDVETLVGATRNVTDRRT